VNNPVYLNPALGACLMILLIFADYIRKYNTNDFQRRLFLIVLGAGFMATATDFVTRTMGGVDGPGITRLLYCSATIFLVSQNVAYYMGIVFIDYFVYNDQGRTRKFIFWILLLLFIQGITLLFNLPYHFFFEISPDNRYTPGPYYGLRLAVSYLPIPICMVDMFISSKLIPSTQRYLIIFFALLTGSGAAVDIIIKTGSLTWPCFAGALLYLYFFIVQADSRLDSLTGIGNRYAFNEFIEKLSRQRLGNPSRGREKPGENRQSLFRRLFPGKGPLKESWSIVMIDMDHFKQINDTLGHAEGDNALRDMVAIIKSCIRHSDFAARYGGDEFVLAVRTENDVETLMTRLKEAIENHNQRNARPYKLEISYGYDIFTTNSGQSINEFLNHIDSLMYKNKEERRRKTDQPEAGHV
jgi:diguanylate cyclase (GGDEF)-like protein